MITKLQLGLRGIALGYSIQVEQATNEEARSKTPIELVDATCLAPTSFSL